MDRCGATATESFKTGRTVVGVVGIAVIVAIFLVVEDNEDDDDDSCC